MHDGLKRLKWIAGIALLLMGMLFGTMTSYANSDDEPFSVLLLGVDTGALGRDEQGRSDVIMIMTVNPKQQQMSLTSIPRDTYVEVPELDFQDKLNHAYAYGGSELSLNVVNAWLESDIRYYMQVDFAGIEHIVDALGGIDVVPPTTFEMGEHTFIEGESKHLTGEMARLYAQERYTSGGDYARQSRQREILQQLIAKLQSTSQLPKVVSVLLKDLKTNMDVFKMMTLYNKYLSSDFHIKTYQLEGTGELRDGIYYDIPEDVAVKALRTRLE